VDKQEQTKMTTKTNNAVITLTFEDAWAQSAERRNYDALQAKDRFEARLLAIIEARANKLLDVLAS
jgi:hypothetical protein